MDIFLLWSPVCAILITIFTGIARLIQFITNKRTNVIINTDKNNVEKRMIKEFISMHSTINSKNTIDDEIPSIETSLHFEQNSNFLNVENEQIKHKAINGDTNIRRFMHEG